MKKQEIVKEFKEFLVFFAKLIVLTVAALVVSKYLES